MSLLNKLDLSKGDELESTVEFIESCILSDLKKSRVADVVVLSKHKKKIHGVTHEVDLHVTINYSNDYKSTFIFECKNWSKEKVNKNEIITFSEKIDAFMAQKGYFIGTSFTEDAINQAKKDPRISIHEAKPVELSTLKYIIVDIPEKRIIRKFTFYEPNEMPGLSDSNSINAKDTNFILKGRSITYDELINTLIRSIMTKEFFKEKIQGEFETVTIDCKEIFQLETNSLFINNVNYDKAFVDFTLTIKKCFPELKFGFDIEKRGKYRRLQAKVSDSVTLVVHEYNIGK